MRIGIDVGGTKIEGIALDDGGGEAGRLRVRTPRDDYAGTIGAIREVVEALERDTGERATVGCGIPGTISSLTGLVKNANSTWLNGRPFAQDLGKALDRPVRMANDANCFALSEARDGSAAAAGVVFGVIIGTGCGGGVVVDGRVIAGANGIAGEWGHNPLPDPRDEERPGPKCYCGRFGCIETFLSGPGLSRDYEHATGQSLAAHAVVERANQGEPQGLAALERYEDRLARSLTVVVNLLDPDVIVFGGGLSNIDRLYRNVPGLLRPFGGELLRTRIVRPRFGDSSGVRGAAWLWENP
jgi:fructokinase